MNIKILVWQNDGNTCRFIYQAVGANDMRVASCEGYIGMAHLMREARAIKLDESINLYDYRRELYKKASEEQAV